MSSPIPVNQDTTLRCMNCGKVMKVSTMGTHLGPCYKGSLKSSVKKQRAAQRRYASTLPQKLSRAKSHLEKLFKKGYPAAAIETLGPRPGPGVGFLSVEPQSPFYFGDSTIEFPPEAKHHFASALKAYTKSVSAYLFSHFIC